MVGMHDVAKAEAYCFNICFDRRDCEVLLTEGAVVDSFKIIYRILRILERSMDLEEFDKENISHERLGISEARWCRLMAMLVAGGYTTGIEVWNSMDQSYPRVALTRPEITLKGLEYLHENSAMRKAAGIAKGMIEILPK